MCVFGVIYSTPYTRNRNSFCVDLSGLGFPTLWESVPESHPIRADSSSLNGLYYKDGWLPDRFEEGEA